MVKRLFVIILLIGITANVARAQSPYQPDPTVSTIEGYTLVWHDEFNEGTKPDSTDWSYEHGFVRNREPQWYQPQNATVKNGLLVIEARKERVKNKFYDAGSSDWRYKRRYAQYTSSSINTSGHHAFKYGIFKIRARIDTAKGLWPAIWLLGANSQRYWPANGEVDIMEFYPVDGQSMILANAAWSGEQHRPIWDTERVAFSHFIEKDPRWPEKFHVWKINWTSEYIRLYLDGELLNTINLDQTLNPDGFNPFHHSHYILLNLALRRNTNFLADITFPKKYEVDYVRVYQKE